MGKTATMRLQARERALAQKFNQDDISRAADTVHAQVSVVRAKATSVEALSRQMARLQSDIYRDLMEMKEQQQRALEHIARRMDEIAGSSNA